MRRLPLARPFTSSSNSLWWCLLLLLQQYLFHGNSRSGVPQSFKSCQGDSSGRGSEGLRAALPPPLRALLLLCFFEGREKRVASSWCNRICATPFCPECRPGEKSKKNLKKSEEAGALCCCSCSPVSTSARMTPARLEMSQQEKWKGMFGRLRNCKKYKKG